jgi:hypothetical protein
MPDGKVVDFTFEALERQAKRHGLACDTSRALYLGLEVPRDFFRKVWLREEAVLPVAELFYLCGDSGLSEGVSDVLALL